MKKVLGGAVLGIAVTLGIQRLLKTEKGKEFTAKVQEKVNSWKKKSEEPVSEQAPEEKPEEKK